MIAGITPDTAKELYAQGFSEFSDLVKLALPSRAVKMGLHKTIARRMMMAEFLRKQGYKNDGKCPLCSGEFDPETGFCKKCRYSPLPEYSEQIIKDRLAKVTGEVENIFNDPDFGRIPKDMKKQVLSEMDLGLEPVQDEERLIQELEDVCSNLDETDERKLEYKMQLEAWRKRGFDVSELEEVLEIDIDSFAQKSVDVIRNQIKKRDGNHTFVCPLCEVAVNFKESECPNCGAIFS